MSVEKTIIFRRLYYFLVTITIFLETVADKKCRLKMVILTVIFLVEKSIFKYFIFFIFLYFTASRDSVLWTKSFLLMKPYQQMPYITSSAVKKS